MSSIKASNEVSCSNKDCMYYDNEIGIKNCAGSYGDELSFSECSRYVPEDNGPNIIHCQYCKGTGKIYSGTLGRAGKYLKGRGHKCRECDGLGFKLVPPNGNQASEK